MVRVPGLWALARRPQSPEHIDLSTDLLELGIHYIPPTNRDVMDINPESCPEMDTKNSELIPSYRARSSNHIKRVARHVVDRRPTGLARVFTKLDDLAECGGWVTFFDTVILGLLGESLSKFVDLVVSFEGDEGDVWERRSDEKESPREACASTAFFVEVRSSAFPWVAVPAETDDAFSEPRCAVPRNDRLGAFCAFFISHAVSESLDEDCNPCHVLF